MSPGLAVTQVAARRIAQMSPVLALTQVGAGQGMGATLGLPSATLGTPT
jgi:hypothetical protein